MLLANGNIAKLERLAILQLLEAHVAPVVLVVASNVVVAVSSDPLRRAIETVTIKDWRLEQELLTSTKEARLSVLSLLIFFYHELFHHYLIVSRKLVLHLLGHVIHNRSFGIVEHCIIEGQMDIGLKVFE